MSATVIKVENLSKSYLIRHQASAGSAERYTALRDVLTNSAKNLGNRLLRRDHSALGAPNSALEEFWALNDVSFEVKQGERVGIIGRNGAGKSTLLKVLSRIVEPTSGRIGIKGQVASLLEVGTGFHPELTGRENIYLNGAILGMTRAEIRRKFDEIVAFAEVEKFLDTPVKRYSSGMYVRLAFAVAAHLEPETLLVDEVLAVGDAEFQKKCLQKMQEVSQGGRTIIFVSHNMASIRQICQRGIILDRGALLEEGLVNQVVDKYLSYLNHQKTLLKSSETNSFIVNQVRIYSTQGLVIKTFDPVEIRILLTAKKDIKDPGVYVGFLSSENQRLAGIDFKDLCTAPPVQAGQQFELGFFIDSLSLLPGSYQIEIHLKDMYEHQIEMLSNSFEFDIAETPVYGGRKTDSWYGYWGFHVQPLVNYSFSSIL